MDTEQQIFGLVAAAQKHQAAVQTALDGLTAERAALAKERAALAQVTGSLQAGASEAVTRAVRESLAGSSKILESAAQPVIGSLSDAAQATDAATGKLTGAVSAFCRKWALVAGGATAGCILAVLAVTWAATSYQREQMTALRAEVAELQAEADDWAKRAGRAQLTTCGEKHRLCARVETKQGGYGKDSDYFILKGY
jgi:cell division protein FtsB